MTHRVDDVKDDVGANPPPANRMPGDRTSVPAGPVSARFAALATATGRPFVIVRQVDGVIVHASTPARVVLLALTGHDPLGQSFVSVASADPLLAAAMAEALAARTGRVGSMPLELNPPGRPPARINLTIEPFADDDGEPSDLVLWSDPGCGEDGADALARRREVAEAAGEAKSEFLARMSHELRTPLNAIIGFAEMLCQQVFGPLGNDKYREYSRDIHESGRHLLHLINDILDMARIQAGRYDLNRRMIDAGSVIETARRRVKCLADDRGIIVRLRVPEGMPRVYADERALRQVLHNLMSNAVRYSPEGGHINVEAQADAATFTVSVSDAGVGIHPEDIERILKPFERGRNIMLTEDGSLGLGLPLARHIIELHGGRLWITSAPDVGTRVSFHMPRVPNQ